MVRYGRQIIIILSMVLCIVPDNAFALTSYYVDPTFTGGSNDGSAANPWTTMTGNWGGINTSLASDNVTIWFSARTAAADTDEYYTAVIAVNRTDCNTQHATGCNALTLNGRSMYNTNDAAGAWTTYTGSSRQHLQVNGVALQWQGKIFANNVTIDGLEIECTNSAPGGCTYIAGGDDFTFTNNESYFTSKDGVPANGPLFQYDYSNVSDTAAPCDPYPSGGRGNCGGYNITITNNTMHDSYGEAIYVGPCNNDGAGVDCNDFNAYFHSGVSIKNNTIYNVGIWGGEGDAIDPHGHMKNLMISGNVVSTFADTSLFTTTGSRRDCIVTEGSALIEDNFLYYCGRAGIYLSDFWDEGDFKGEGTIIRNNVVVDVGHDTDYGPRHGIYVETQTGRGSYDWTAVDIYNNTVLGGANTISAIIVGSQATTIQVRNNIGLYTTGTEFSLGGTSVTSHTNNLAFDDANKGTIASYNSSNYTATTITTWEATAVASDPALADTSQPYADTGFKLTDNTSPAYDSGATLSGFADDYAGIDRPKGSAWDIGAWELVVPATGVPGKGVMIIR